jgi:hypothetical protein
MRTAPSNMALQRTRRPRLRSGRSLRSLGSPLNACSLGRGVGDLHRDIFRRPTVSSPAEPQEVI